MITMKNHPWLTAIAIGFLWGLAGYVVEIYTGITLSGWRSYVYDLPTFIAGVALGILIATFQSRHHR